MVILLLIFVFAILFTAAAMLIIYYIYNRKSDERGYEFSGSFTEDSVAGSQVMCRFKIFCCFSMNNGNALSLFSELLLESF